MKVANPKLSIYAFHLRNNLAKGEDEPVNNANHLWEECQRIGQKLHVPRLESLIERLQESNGQIGVSSNQDNSRYLELLQPKNTLKLSAIPEGSTLQLVVLNTDKSQYKIHNHRQEQCCFAAVHNIDCRSVGKVCNGFP